MIAKLDKSGKDVDILEDDVKVLCFLKDVNGRLYVKLSFQIPQEERSPTAIVPMKAVNSKDLLNYLPENYVIRFASSLKQQAYMRYIIYEAQNVAPCYDMVKQGYNTGSHGELLYGFGDVIIGSQSPKCFVWNPNELRANMSLIKKTRCMELFDWAYAWTKHAEHLAALLIVALSPFVYPILKDLSPQSEALNAYLVGKTGSGKSSFATLITDLFQGKEYSFSLIANKDAFYKLIKHRSHIPILIDDLNKSAASDCNYKKIGKLSEIIQTKSSAGIFDGDLSAEDMKKISLIITAEEALKAPSSMNRCVVIKFPYSFDAELLTEMQTNNLFPTLVYRLVSWICHGREEICKRVANELLNMKINLPYESITSAGEARIGMSYKTMLITQVVVMEFMKCCIGKEGRYMKKYNKLKERLTDGITEAVRNTKEAARSLDENNVLTFFVDLFKYDPDKVIAKSVDEYFNSNGKLIFCYEGIYYFRGEEMQKYLKSRFYTISNKRISDELQQEGLLYTRKKECSFPLPKKIRNHYKQGAERYYRIYADVMDSLVESKCDSVLELFGSSLRKYM